MINRRSFTMRLTVALALLLVAYGAFIALLGRHVAVEHESESLQRLSHGIARHIVEHWPTITASDPDAADRAARKELLSMLMVVNPAIQVYVLDAEGSVSAYVGEPGMVRVNQVDLAPVRAFLAGASLPLRGSDPMGSGVQRLFSAAMFPPKPTDSRPPGYLYVVLDGQARDQVAGQLSLRRVWQGASAAVIGGLLITLLLGAYALRRLTQPLQRLAARMRRYGAPGAGIPSIHGNEIQSISDSFDDLRTRIEAQTIREREQMGAHREMMASVAHDLRTPLTALHGQLEALASNTIMHSETRGRVFTAALAQSDKVRRLSQQLFELATLQSSDQVLHRERFRLDELVTDAVQKFEYSTATARVTVNGEPPGPLELDGDLQLIERALTNLIDNAVRHAPGGAPVHVSVRLEGTEAHILVDDAGPGLPTELRERLELGQSLRDPPPRRSSGGIGGLGLAIAQRIAVLHGGSLRPLPSLRGGTRLCLALPLAA